MVERMTARHCSGIAIVEGKNGRLQPVIKTCDLKVLVVAVGNSPARNPFDPALDPPTIKNAEAGDAVERRLHTAGARCLEWTARRIQPQIDPCGKHRRELPFVIFQVDDFERVGIQLGSNLKDLPDQLLAWFVMGMSLAAKENLHAAELLRAAHQALGIG